MLSSSRSAQTTSSESSEVITNQVDGNGDGNLNVDLAGSDGNTFEITETDQGSVAAAFDFAVASLDTVRATSETANDFSRAALGAASDSIRDQGAVNSENIIKTITIGAVAVALAFVGVKVIK